MNVIEKLKKMKKKINFKKDIKDSRAGMTDFDPRILIALKDMDEEKKKDLLERLRQNTFKMEEVVMEEVYKEGILTKKEYEKEYRHKYICPVHGGDSFPEFMQSVLFNKRNPDPADQTIFVTTNSTILNDREKLTEKFGLVIKTPREAIEVMEENNVEDIDEVFQAM